MLTKKQKDLLILIHERVGEEGIPPSFDEMREALGLKSKSGIHRLITALVERGYLERLPNRARALEVKRLPEGYGANKSSRQPQASMSATIAATQMASIPLMGRIAAGTPIEAIRDESTLIEVPPALMGSGEYYALEVDGDSMVKAGINDGDTVIIKRCDNAEDGAIIVALVDGEDVTLKRLKRTGGKIHLIPENDDYETRVLEPSRVRIQGRLTSLMRTYH